MRAIDLEKCSTDDIDKSLNYVLTNKNLSKKELLLNVDEDIKEAVFNIKWLIDDLLLEIPENTTLKQFKYIFLEELKNSWDLYHYGIASKLIDIQNNRQWHNYRWSCNKCPHVIDMMEYSELIHNSPLVLFNWSPQEWYQVKKVTKNVSNLTWYSDQEFLEKWILFTDIIHKDDIDRINKEVLNYTTNLKLNEFEQEYRIITKDWNIKEIFDRTLVKYNKNGTIDNLYWFIYDITESKTIEWKVKEQSTRLTYLVHHDEKSWLPNQLKCNEYIENEKIEHFILFKIRNFDKVNSLLWRHKWEEVLLELIKEYLWIEKEFHFIQPKLYRISATEFWITMKVPPMLTLNLHEVTNNLANYLKKISLSYDWFNLFLEHSIWAVFYEKDDLFNKTQIALDQAKKREDKIILYNQNLWDDLSLHYNNFYGWIKKIKEALEKQLNKEEWNLRVYYQGIRNNKSWEIEKYESLIRYYEPQTKRIVSPYHFLDHVKQAKMVSKITKVVIIETIKNLKENPWINLTINFTLDDLKNDELIKFLLKEVIDNNIDIGDITLEILEDISVVWLDIYDKILEFKNAWFKIAIDDFWTWYSNFERLVNIRPDFIKIDWSLIQWLLKSPEKEKIVKSIIMMWHWLNSKIIAEFVDDEQIQKKLESMWVDYSQWFLFSEPKPFKERTL